MAIFHIHLETPEGLQRDDAGVEAADLDAVRAECVASVPDMARDRLRRGLAPMDCAFIITDADGVEVLRVPFSEAVGRRLTD